MLFDTEISKSSDPHTNPREVSVADERWMRAALLAASEAEQRGEVPVGACVVVGAELLAVAGNLTRTECDPTAHAEMVALRLNFGWLDRIGSARTGALWVRFQGADWPLFEQCHAAEERGVCVSTRSFSYWRI